MVVRTVEQRFCDRCERVAQEVKIIWGAGEVTTDLCQTHLDEILGGSAILARTRALVGLEPRPLPEIVRPERPPAAVVRAWAKEQGIEVPDRGRVPSPVFVEYARAHPA